MCTCHWVPSTCFSAVRLIFESAQHPSSSRSLSVFNLRFYDSKANVYSILHRFLLSPICSRVPALSCFCFPNPLCVLWCRDGIFRCWFIVLYCDSVAASFFAVSVRVTSTDLYCGITTPASVCCRDVSHVCLGSPSLLHLHGFCYRSALLCFRLQYTTATSSSFRGLTIAHALCLLRLELCWHCILCSTVRIGFFACVTESFSPSCCCLDAGRDRNKFD